jgi:ferredoxin-NADP reductase
MNYQITQCRMLSQNIKEITVTAQTTGQGAPAAGAHFKWWIPGYDQWRHYSTVQLNEHNLSADSHVFAIRLSDDSASSGYIRGLVEGDIVRLDGPFNAFTYTPGKDDDTDIAIAGGIGITPLTGILGHLNTLGRPVHLHYFAKCEAQAAYAAEMRNLLQDRVTFHYSSHPEGRPSVSAVLDRLQPHDRLYVCGPQGMLNEVFSHAETLGLARERIHFEVFNTERDAHDSGFDVEAVESGVMLRVNADQSLLDALEAAGLDPLYDCRRGECGVCALDVLEGEVEHRDFIMSAKEAACSGRIYPCVSRAKSPSLKLAL